MLRKIIDSAVVLGEGARFAGFMLKRRGKGYKRYAGSPIAICKVGVRH